MLYFSDYLTTPLLSDEENICFQIFWCTTRKVNYFSAQTDEFLTCRKYVQHTVVLFQPWSSQLTHYMWLSYRLYCVVQCHELLSLSFLTELTQWGWILQNLFEKNIPTFCSTIRHVSESERPIIHSPPPCSPCFTALLTESFFTKLISL